MDNSTYVPNPGHLNSPALVVFSQAAGGLQDALRIQRPFNPQFQMSEASKELHRPYSATGFGLRHMEAYGGLPAHILNHLPPQFLHPGLSLGSGAFRPLGDLKTFPSPSAFAPPKCLKIETGSDVHGNHGHGIFSPSDERFLGPSPRTDSCSPASASMSPQPQGNLGAVKEESLDAQMSEDGEAPHSAQQADNDSPGIHEDNRGFRLGPLFGGGFGNGAYAFSMPGLPPAAHAIAKSSFLFDHVNKKKRDPSSCPVCGLTIPPGDLETHFMHELERLYKLNGTGIAAGRKRAHEPGRPPALPGDSGPEGRWETFQRIKTNRQGRLRIKIRKRKTDDCLICIDRVHRTPEEMNMHAQQCLRKNVGHDEDETVDVEGDSEFEEWAEGQRRRTNSLIAGWFRLGATPSSTGRLSADVDGEGDDVIVDGDEPEESTFGPTQYTESDVVIKLNEDKKEDSEGVQSQVATVNSSGDVEVKLESHGQQCDSNVSTSDAEPSSRAQMIEELRNRIRQLEAEGNGEMATTTDPEDYKCLICLEHYKKPVISTVCWHVHCEECWLHTLGSKKVCPQCSMITSPTDLRRIFM
ncbi:PREDICTED: E3 ubiquitin-protein ligase RNF220-like isoform X2 [Nicrophorus vespilloides]|uniref:E3 ubiquitin-protein ligase RNF220-like isoform X2 n=1 Tax=Nicrophorus vespilloides TaxID=110193 RepID=A0ABM1MYR8_NICVS|nr:PREDICTED: E3 ubiquitin-protein ligase RNF220-like isoform X2 [Nicrophorus vespilloides]